MRYFTAIFALAAGLSAQQTIFDVPSADVAVRNDWFYQHQTVARAWSPNHRWIQTNAYGYGVGRHTEFDVTWSNLDVALPRLSNVSVGFKTSLPVNGEHARAPVHFVFGDLVQVDGAGRKGNWAYSMMQVETPRTGTRLTGGLSSGTSVFFGEQTTGVLGGVEQPLGRHWMFQADWFSGRHDLAYVIPGLVYKFHAHWMASFGYQIPNRHAHGYRAVVLELTRF